VAEELNNHGYHTYAAVTNWNICPVFNFHQGFEKYLPLGKNDPTSVTDAALKLVSEGLANPFFLWIHYLDPHKPYNPPENYVKMFKGDPQYYRDLNPTNYIKKRKDQGPWGSTPTAKEVADALACYDGEIRAQDEQFKRLFCFLRDEGYLNNSLVIFTSDHGEFFGHHGYYFDHGPSPYRELQVPLFWYCPGLIPPKHSDHPVELVDVVPTMLSLVGIKPKEMKLAGVDLSDFITKEDGKIQFPRTYAMGTSYVTDQKGFPQFFILRSKKYELIVNKFDHIKRPKSLNQLIEFSNSTFKLEGQGVELYNMVSDPFERKNLVLKNPEIADSMLKALGEMLFKYATTYKNTQVQSFKLSEKDLAIKKIREELKSLGYIK